MPASIDGIPVFGLAVSITPQPNANQAQVNAFFGVQGVMSLDGGQRGRIFLVEGMLASNSPANVVAAEFSLSQLADGLPHVLVDTTGNGWAAVVYRNEYQRTSKFLQLAGGNGFGVRYKMVLHGLL